MEKEKPRLKFDPKHPISYGYWSCNTCEASFYGGGEPLHKENCEMKDQGYDSCIYNFGPKELEIIKEGRMSIVSPSFLTLENLLEFFPELIE